jgi:hypothetical protein
MQKFNLRQYLIIVISCFLWILPCCNPQQTAENKKIISQAEMDSFRFRAINTYPEYDDVPRILNLLKDLDLIYAHGAVNSEDNLDKYTDNDMLLAANIGVYITDIGYMWSYGKIHEAINHNIIVFALAEQLGMNSDYLESFFARYSKQDADPDSILYLLDEDLGNAINQFPAGKRLEYYSAMLTGSFIEKLHLIYKFIGECSEISDPAYLSQENIQRLIWIAEGQTKALDDMNKLIENYDIPKEQLFYHEDLCRLDSIMKQSAFLIDSTIVNTSAIQENSGFIELHNEIERIRNLITNPDIQTVR